MDINTAFKLFDIRGKFPQVVDERLAYALAKALTKWRDPHKVLVCCDTRESSPSLKEFLADGFASGSVAVYDLGEAPLPMFNFAMTQGPYDLGIMVTASHVSEDENGFKMVLPGPLPLDEKQVQEVKQIINAFKDESIVVPKIPVQKVTVGDSYTTEILNRVGSSKPKLKIAVDATKSAVLTTIMVLFQKLAADVHFVSSKVSGNPLIATNRKALEKDVVASKSDLGVIWDSDGDRVVFVDRRGQLIPISFVLGILAAAAIAAGRTKKVAVDIRAGLVVRDLVADAGGQLQILPAWNTYIKFAMHDDPEIVFGGETSGHFIFPDFFAIDDGILAALRFIRLFDQGVVEEKLQDLSKKYFELPEQNIPCPTEKAATILEKLTEHYRKSDCLISVVDGLTVFGPNFKFNLRESVTEPFLRLNLETPDEKTAKEIKEKVVQLIS
ncbi:hypothetical protein HY440_03390 [Candidatus Microgenomates bacterium]|nr:hypothetical protein [Candidatus Microgenomates bacterium]